MKLAFTTEDGATISRHFGRAPYYLVVELAQGEIVSQELRAKAGHVQFVQEVGHEQHDHDHGDHDGHDHSDHDDHGHQHSQRPHGMGKGAQQRHARMFTPIADCQVMVSGGMGTGAYQFLQSQGLQPILTDLEDISAAVQAYLDGTLENRVEWLH